MALDWAALTKIKKKKRVAESTVQDQTARMCRLILLYTLHEQTHDRLRLDKVLGWNRLSLTEEYISKCFFLKKKASPSWSSGERVGLMIRWLWVRYPVEANIFSGVFSPLTSAEACEKSSRWLWKESYVSIGVRKPGNTCASPTAMIWP